MSKKLTKKVENGILTIIEGVTGTTLTFDLHKLPKEIYTPCRMADHGALQKYGDAAAAKEGQEAVDAINAVHTAAMNGEWTQKAQPRESVSVSSLQSLFDTLSAKDKQVATKKFDEIGLAVVDGKVVKKAKLEATKETPTA